MTRYAVSLASLLLLYSCTADKETKSSAPAPQSETASQNATAPQGPTTTATTAKSPTEPAKLILTTEELAPFNFTDKSEKLKGIAIEIVDLMMKDARIEYEVQMLPWARAYALALKEPDHCAFATYVTDKRKPLFNWVGPLLHTKWGFYAKKGFQEKHKIEKLEDAKKFLIGGYLADAPTGFLQDRGFKVEMTSENRLNAHKLSGGRIQLWAASHPSGLYTARIENIKDIEHIFTFYEIPMSISCNKGVPVSMLTRLQTALDKLEQSGVADKIRKKYQ